VVNKMDQEKTTPIFELAGELLKGDYEVAEINQILIEVANNIEMDADEFFRITAERTGKQLLSL